MLTRLVGIEDRVYVQVGELRSRSIAIADEDLERSDDEKTSAVHFLRFELTAGAGCGAEGRGAADRRHRP